MDNFTFKRASVNLLQVISDEHQGEIYSDLTTRYCINESIKKLIELVNHMNLDARNSSIILVSALPDVYLDEIGTYLAEFFCTRVLGEPIGI